MTATASNNLKKRIEYAIQMEHDFIAEKNGIYNSGKWDEVEKAKDYEWNILGSVAELARR